MFCPKCGTKNPENGKFCRSCGTDLSPVSDALAGKSSSQWQNFGTMKPIKPLEPMDLWNHKGKPVHWEGAFGKLFMGIAFMVVSIVLAISGRGTGWWFWMLIPAFSMLGAGIAQIMQLRKNEKRMLSVTTNETQNNLEKKQEPNFNRRKLIMFRRILDIKPATLLRRRALPKARRDIWKWIRKAKQ